MNSELRYLRDRLTTKEGISFVPADEKILKGAAVVTEKDSGQKGKNVFLAIRPPYKPRKTDLMTGKTIKVGETEKYGETEIRCFTNDKKLHVRCFKNGQPESIMLTYVPADGEDTSEIDEGLFTWFGPIEDISTPWTEDEPPQCQVITLEDLRDLAEELD